MELFGYLLVVFLFSVAPGPGMILNAIIALNHGLKSAFSSLAGMTTGISFYAVLSFFFIDFISKTPVVLHSIQFLGSVYVIYMGYKKIISHKIPKLDVNTKKIPDIKFYLEGLALSLSGPKPIIFFTTIMPPFIDFNINVGEQVIVYTLIFLAIMLFINVSYTILSLKLADKINESGKYIPMINHISGYFFVLLGVYLIINTFI